MTRLHDAGLSGEATEHSDVGIRLHTPVDVGALPGFEHGDVSVQDEASQLAAGVLNAQRGTRVLDACAAPGGKAAHLQERAGNELELVAVDIGETRVARLRENFARLGLRVDTDKRLRFSPWNQSVRFLLC